MIRVILADDHRVVLQGLKNLLENEKGIEVIGQASNGLEAIALVEKLKPDVLVMDLMMPNVNGLEAARLLKRREPNIKIIILSMHDSEPYIIQALRYGVLGYIPKESSAEELVKAIRTVSNGKRYLSGVLSDLIIDSFINRGESGELDPYDTLTERERLVFQMVAEGNSNADVAEVVSISQRTVETHRANMMRKLGLNTQTDVIRYAIKKGVISLDG